MKVIEIDCSKHVKGVPSDGEATVRDAKEGEVVFSPEPPRQKTKIELLEEEIASMKQKLKL